MNVFKDFSIEGEKLLREEVDLFSWSPNRDMLAVSDLSGQLHLHRFSNLDHIWSLPSPKESKINSICWRPDGTVIAVAYNSADVGIHFIHMEKATRIFKINDCSMRLKHPSVHLCWHEMENNQDGIDDIFQSLSFEHYISDLPEKEDTDDSYNFKAVLEMKKFNLMLSLNANGELTLYAYGAIPLATIVCDNFQNDKTQSFIFQEAHMTPNMDYLTTVWHQKIEKKQDTVNSIVQVYDIKKIFVNMKTWNDVSLKILRVVETINYIVYLFEVMKEHCEDLVHQMETRLLDSIAENQFETSVGDDLLHYLVWGSASFQLEHLLVNCLKENMLERFKKMLLTSNVFFKQTLLSNMQTAADTLYYLFNELKGMNGSKLFPDLEIVFDEKMIGDLIICSGELCLKTYELLEVYLEHAGNFQLFIKWLNISIQKLKLQTAKVEKMTQKELEEVADFILESFVYTKSKDTKESSGKRFNLDRIYQYFQTAGLQKEAKIYRDNEWMKLITSSSALLENPLIIKPDRYRTLGNIVEQMETLVNQLILGMTKKIQHTDCMEKEITVVLPSSATPGAPALRATQSFLPTYPDFYPDWTRSVTMCVNEQTNNCITFIDVLIPPRTFKDVSVKSAVYGVWFADVNEDSEAATAASEFPVTYADIKKDRGTNFAVIADVRFYNNDKFFALYFADSGYKMCLMRASHDPIRRVVRSEVKFDDRSVHDVTKDGTEGRPLLVACMTDLHHNLARMINCTEESHYYKLQCCANRNVGCLLSSDRKKLISLDLDYVYDDDEDDDSLQSEEDEEEMNTDRG